MRLSRRRFLQLCAATVATVATYGVARYLLHLGAPYHVSRSASKSVPLVDGKAPVAIRKGEDVEGMVREALDLIGGLGLVVSPGDQVLIKPNYTWVSGTQPLLEVEANTTDPRVIEALVKMVKEIGGDPVIGEGSGGCETMDAFTLRGVDEVAQRYGIELIDLNRTELVRVDNESLSVFTQYWMPKTVQEADVIISVPCLKAWPLTGITVGLKNLIGTAPGEHYGWPKEGLPHGTLPEPTIDRVIVDLAYINRVNLVVVDGLWGNEGTYTKGFKPIKMDLILTGFDPVATDCVAASVMGFDPLKIRHLNLARERGIGTNRMEDILLKGEKVDDVARPFEPPEGLEHIRA